MVSQPPFEGNAKNENQDVVEHSSFEADPPKCTVCHKVWPMHYLWVQQFMNPLSRWFAPEKNHQFVSDKEQ